MLELLATIAFWTVPTKTLKTLAAQHRYKPGEVPLDLSRVPDSWLPPGFIKHKIGDQNG